MYALDHSEQKAKMHEFHFGLSHYDVKDIHALTVAAIPNVTLAHASFPCTDTSVAGGRMGLSGGESSALWGFTKLLAAMGDSRPPLILLENVEGFLTSNNGQDITMVLATLHDLGYSLDIMLVDAAHFVPQSRVRLFITGVLHLPPQDIFEQERILRMSQDVRPEKVQKVIRRLSNIRWLLAEVPTLPTRTLQITEILDLTEPWWETPRSMYLYHQMHQAHQMRVQALMRQDMWFYGTAFRRMRQRDGAKQSTAEIRTDGIAGCLRTPKGGSARQILFRAGWNQFDARLLNARECARLMGADNYKMSETLSLNDALFGFGDAVCVPVVEWITLHALNPRYAQLAYLLEEVGLSRG
jgi:DNA (cytosine-5)-methyltransferase 1